MANYDFSLVSKDYFDLPPEQPGGSEGGAHIMLLVYVCPLTHSIVLSVVGCYRR